MDFIETMFLNLNSLNLPKNLGLEYILFAKNMMHHGHNKNFCKKVYETPQLKNILTKKLFLIMQNMGQH